MYKQEPLLRQDYEWSKRSIGDVDLDQYSRSKEPLRPQDYAIRLQWSNGNDAYAWSIRCDHVVHWMFASDSAFAVMSSVMFVEIATFMFSEALEQRGTERSLAFVCLCEKTTERSDAVCACRVTVFCSARDAAEWTTPTTHRTF